MSGTDKESCTCTWNIEDTKFWLYKQIKGLRSCSFKTEATGETEWTLQFVPAKDELLELVLRRGAVDPTSTQMSCELSVLAADGEVVRVHKMEVEASKEGDFCGGVCVKPTDVVECENDPMSKGKLTVRCKMWRHGMRPSLSFARTIFQQKTFPWKIEQFQSTPIPVKGFQIESLEFIIVLYKGESYELDKNVDVKIVQTKGESSARCSIRVVGDDGKSKTLPYDHHLSNVSDDMTYWSFRIPVKDEYLANGALSLKCEFTVGVSEISNYEQRVHPTTTQQNRSQTKSSRVRTTIPPTSSLREDLFRLYTEGKFCDVNLLAGDTSFPVHKSVICARSSVLCEMFEKNSEDHRNGVHIKDLDRVTLDRLLLYMYNDTLDNIVWSDASALYYAAKKFAILSLKDKCMAILEAKLTVFNVCDALQLADTHQEEDLMQSVEDFICDHHIEVLSSTEWKDLEKAKPSLTTRVLRDMYLKEKQKIS